MCTTCKIASEMTYNVSGGTLNPTIPLPYHDDRCHVTGGCLSRFDWLIVFDEDAEEAGAGEGEGEDAGRDRPFLSGAVFTLGINNMSLYSP